MFKVKIVCAPKDLPLKFPADVVLVEVKGSFGRPSNTEVKEVLDKWQKNATNMTLLRYEVVRDTI